MPRHSFRRSIPAIAVWVALLLTAITVSAAPKKAAPIKSASGSTATQIITIPSTPKSSLDTARVRKLYLDGDFDEAIELLVVGLNEKRKFNHEDSVFIYKHLGVMYAAKYDTREKGKYYMHQLLTVEPTAKILDMYASDMIYMIFKNIQDELDATRRKYDRAEQHVAENSKQGQDSESGAASKTSKEKSAADGNGTGYWIGATGAVVAAGVAAYFIFGDSPETRKVDGVFPQQ